MPEPSDNYEPSEADLELIIEETTGKPKKPANLAAGIASLRQRIVELEAEKSKLLDQMDTPTRDFAATVKDQLTTVSQDLVTARERLTYYEAQRGQQN